MSKQTTPPKPNVAEAAMMKRFSDAGFSAVTPEIPRRVLVGSQGQERTGKTDWALRTPAPIIYIGLDFGHEGVIEKHAKKRMIYANIFNVPSLSDQAQYIGYWQKLEDSIYKAIDHQDVRTVVMDTGTDIWELLRMAEFGTLQPRGDIKSLYSKINVRYRALIRAAYDKEINLVVIHKVKKTYVARTIQTNRGPQTQEVWEGGYERTGFGEGGYLIQCQIEHLYDPTRGKKLEDKFGIRVLDCRQNMGIAGQELWGEENSFAYLGAYIFDNDPSDWA